VSIVVNFSEKINLLKGRHKDIFFWGTGPAKKKKSALGVPSGRTRFFQIPCIEQSNRDVVSSVTYEI